MGYLNRNGLEGHVTLVGNSGGSEEDEEALAELQEVNAILNKDDQVGFVKGNKVVSEGKLCWRFVATAKPDKHQFLWWAAQGCSGARLCYRRSI